jgi:hypothetical protein
MSAAVHPRDVEALKARVGPAVLAVAATLRSPEAGALAHRWSEYCAHRATWATAPAELELGHDLEAQLALLQGPGTRRGKIHAVGSILGFWSVGELHDLLAAKAYEVTQINAAANACAPSWAAADPVSYGKWAGDLYDANQAFAKAQTNAQQVLDLVPQAMWSFTPAGSAWDEVIQASHPFNDLSLRMVQQGRCAPADFSKTPQPTASDLDLKIFQATDVATKKIEGAASSVSSAVSSRGNWFALGALLALGAVVLIKVAR